MDADDLDKITDAVDLKRMVLDRLLERHSVWGQGAFFDAWEELQEKNHILYLLPSDPQRFAAEYTRRVVDAYDLATWNLRGTEHRP